MSCHSSLNNETNIIVEIETLQSIYPTFENVTEKPDDEYIKLQIRLYPKLTEASFSAKEGDIHVLTLFEIPRDFPKRELKVSFEEFHKMPWEKTEMLRKKIAEFYSKKLNESNNISVTVYVMQIATEIEEGLYFVKHGYRNQWNESRLGNICPAKELEFIDSFEKSGHLRGDACGQSDTRLLTRSHEIVQVKVSQPGWSRYLARTAKGELRIIDHIFVDVKCFKEKQQKGKGERTFNPDLIRQPLQRLKENQFHVLKNLSHGSLCSYTDFLFECTTSHIRIEWIRSYNEAILLADLVGQSGDCQILSLQSLPPHLHRIITGLHELHECEFYHGNLTLSSLCLDQKGNLILLDYFLPSAVFHEVTSTGLVDFASYPFAKNTQNKFEDLNILGLLTAQIFKNSPELPNDLDENSSIEGCPLPLVRFIRKCLQARNETNIVGILRNFFQARKTPTCLYDMQSTSVTSPNGRKDTNGYGDSIALGNCDGRARFSSDVYAGLSRLTCDFKDLGEIGKGGYGRVIKALHKIDQRIYAIKVIKLPLNSAHNNLRQAFKREVTMLSQLDHENVVRYYQAWFDVDPSGEDPESEVSESESDGESSKESDLFASRDYSHRPTRRRYTPATTLGDENTSSDVVSFRDGVSNEHSAAFVANSKSLILSRRSSNLGSRRLVDVDCEGESSFEKRDRSSSHSDPTESSEDEYSNSLVNNILCLQMEYCESATIEQLITQNLYQKEDEVLRLFREMMEGLNYIHSKNLIHRDLKPANIFVDSENHIKIGDFGLAMSAGVESNRINYVAGTMHYLAPELLKGKVMYTQKVDIYSLGLIFFEMNCPPFTTISEKIRVFTDLKENIFPSEFKYSSPTDLNYQIITKMLSKDPVKRPGAKDIIPSLPPKLADESFQEVLRKVLEKPDSTRYRNLLNTIFGQKSLLDSKINFPPSPETAQVIFDSFMSKHLIFDRIYDIMSRHGAIQIDLPNFYNRSLIKRPIPDAMHLLSEQGNILSMPFDLRVPFTAFVAKNNLEYDMKTFCIDKVYRQGKFDSTSLVPANSNFTLAPQGPEEKYEMIFDIISRPTYNCLVEAEVLLVTVDILLSFDTFKNDSFCIYLNHSKLLEALLSQHQMNESERRNILQILLKHGPSASPATKRKSMAKGFTKLKDLCQAYKDGTGLCRNLVRNYERQKFEQEFIEENPNLKDDPNFQTALADIKTLLKHLSAIGIPNQFSLYISPGVINYLNTEGLLFQVSLTSNTDFNNSNNSPGSDDIILATGMMNQNLIAKFSNSKHYPKHEFGVRIDLQQCIDREGNIIETKNFDCVIVPLDSDASTISESFNIAKMLWKDLNVRTELLKYAESENRAVRFCEKEGIPVMIFIDNKQLGKRKKFRVNFLELKDHTINRKEVFLDDLCEEVANFIERKFQANENSANTKKVQLQVICNKRTVVGIPEMTLDKLKPVTDNFANFDTIHIVAHDLDAKTMLAFIYDLQMKTEISKLTCIGSDNKQNRTITEMMKYVESVSKIQVTTQRILILYSLTDDKHLIVDCFN